MKIKQNIYLFANSFFIDFKAKKFASYDCNDDIPSLFGHALTIICGEMPVVELKKNIFKD